MDMTHAARQADASPGSRSAIPGPRRTIYPPQNIIDEPHATLAGMHQQSQNAIQVAVQLVSGLTFARQAYELRQL
jgi:hypothetical protein